MKVKVCYARVRVNGTFSTSESTKTRFLNKRLKKFAAEGHSPLPKPYPSGEGTHLPAPRTHSVPSAPRGPPQTKCLDPPLGVLCPLHAPWRKKLHPKSILDPV